MKYTGPMGVPRVSRIGPLVSESPTSGDLDLSYLERQMAQVADDVEVTNLGGGDAASVDFRLRIDPKRERKSSVIWFDQIGLQEATLRFPLIDPNLMSHKEVVDGMETVLTRSDTPDGYDIQNVTRTYSFNTGERAHNPHVVLDTDVDIDYEGIVAWVERVTRNFSREFPEYLRLSES